MRHGINLGNRLDALPARPVPDAWFDLVRDAGFDTVRLPARWSAHAAATAPYLGAAQRAPRRARCSTVEHVAPPVARGRPWADPDRTVLIGPAPMNDADALPALELPADAHVRATVHYYAPLRFTHQGAHWVDGADGWRDVGWGSTGDLAAVTADLERLAAHGDVFVGEFGTYERADLASRVRWTAFVRGELERLGLDWCYWDLATDFGVYDPAAGAWREPLREALLP